MEAYVTRKKNTVVQYIVTHKILDLYKETVQIPGTWLEKRWWEHEELDLVGVWVAEAAEEEEGRRGIYGQRSGGSSRELKHGTK